MPLVWFVNIKAQTMKILFFLSLFALSTFVFISCVEFGDIDAIRDTKFQEQLGYMTSGELEVFSILLGTSDPQGDWSNFRLSFTGDQNGGNYTSINTPSGFEAVWPSGGSWDFDDNLEPTKIIRDGNIPMTVTPSGRGDHLIIVFTIDTGAGRTMVVDGQWTFTMKI